MRLTFVANGARVRDAWRRLDRLCRSHAGDSYEAFHVTDGPGHATELAAKAVADGADAVVAVGGDGTAHEVLQGLAGTGAAIGVVPYGTGNDFAFHLGIPRETESALRGIGEAPIVAADRLEVNGRAIATAVLWGSGAAIGDEADRLRKRIRSWEKLPGAARAAVYQAAAVGHLFRDPDEPFSIEMESDAGARHFRAWSAAIGDSRRIGGAFLAFPAASKDDGVANLLVVGAGPWTRRVWTSALLRFGLHQARPGVQTLTLSSATLEMDRPMAWLADGELLPPAQRFEVRVVRGGLRLLLPRRAS